MRRSVVCTPATLTLAASRTVAAGRLEANDDDAGSSGQAKDERTTSASPARSVSGWFGALFKPPTEKGVLKQ